MGDAEASFLSRSLFMEAKLHLQRSIPPGMTALARLIVTDY
jgi:hypothetical protein